MEEVAIMSSRVLPYYDQQSTSSYEQRGGGYGGGYQSYQGEEVVEEGSKHHGSHGMAYGALGAGAGLAAGAGLMYEGEKIRKTTYIVH